VEKLLGIIIPVYNESENIERTLTEIEAAVSTPHRIYIVYDFEEDDTLPVARELKKRGIDIQFLKNDRGGVCNAIKSGLFHAKEDYLLVTMADMSDDFRAVDRMYQLMQKGWDLVCGSRYMKGGRQIGGPWLKKTLSRLAGVSLRYVTGLPTHDATNSFKLYRKRLFDSINIESDTGFVIGMEIVIKAYFSGFSVTEIPCTWTDREKGKSRFKTFQWGPYYLRWYLYAIGQALLNKRGGCIV